MRRSCREDWDASMSHLEPVANEISLLHSWTAKKTYSLEVNKPQTQYKK